MVQLQLDPEEAQMLSQILQRHLSDLEIEIRHTDSSDFKTLLKQKREGLMRLAQKLPAPAKVPA